MLSVNETSLPRTSRAWKLAIGSGATAVVRHDERTYYPFELGGSRRSEHKSWLPVTVHLSPEKVSVPLSPLAALVWDYQTPLHAVLRLPASLQLLPVHEH